MKAKITFTNGEVLTINEDEVFITFVKTTEDTAEKHRRYTAYRNSEGTLVPGIMDMLVQGNYFFINENPQKVYNPNAVVSVESDFSTI